ncbi:MAG: T9SS type A sorting domain-containing protein, partial [Vallitaleaceae bacterium]|nr:T9SS type A sorting domain-containing protein [Vallitaleaceae bacterium]
VINYWGVYWPSATEFHPDGSVALEMDFTQHSHSPRILKYLWETKVFESDRDTINYGSIENSEATTENIVITNNKSDDLVLTGFSAHTNLFTVSNAFPITIPAGESASIGIVFNAQEANQGNYEDLITLSADTDTERIARQVWVFAEKTTDITGLENQEKKISSFTIAPSPTKGTLTLTTFDAKNKKIEIHSIRGKLVYSAQTHAEMKFQIDVSSYKNGIYLVSLTDENNQKQTQKLIIQN